jgi:CHAT domain-containing protein
MMKTSLPNASLAFLSACTTATGTDKAADEGLHLAAAMQFAGFQGVVGTLW